MGIAGITYRYEYDAEADCFYTVIVFSLTDETTYEVKVPSGAPAPGTTYEAATTEELLNLLAQGVTDIELTADNYDAASGEAIDALFSYGAPQITVTSDFAITPETVGADRVAVSGDTTLVIPEGKTITIGSGFDNYVVIRTVSGGTLTIEGEGTIDATNADDGTVPVAAMAANSSVIVEGGTIIVDTPGESCLFAGGGGKVIVNGGTFINNSTEDYAYGVGAPLTVNVSNSASVTDMVINGGTFYGRNPALGDDNLGGTFVAEGKTCIQQADGSYVVVSLDEAAENAVALVNGAAYTDLAAAIAAANAVEGTALVKVEVLQDATVTGITLTRDNVTLQGLGVDVTTITATEGGTTGAAGLYIGAAANVTVKDMAIVLTGGTKNTSPIKVSFSGGTGDHSVSSDVTLQNLRLVGNNLGSGLNLHGVDGAVVDNVTVENYAKVGISLAYATDVEISNVTFTNENCWGDIGMMYAADNPDYAVPVKGVTLGENIEFAAYHIYAENLSYEMDYSAYSDVFGLVESENRWDLVNVIQPASPRTA